MFTVYKTTYVRTGQYYYGKHETDNPNDDYLGSGIWIKRAVKKHGKENFKKEVLFIFPTEIEAFAQEVGFIAAAKDDQFCMNFHEGGKGGFRYIKEHGLIPSIPKELITGRPKGSKNLVKPILEIMPCAYECGKEAKFLLGKKEVPCCSDHFAKCTGYQARKTAVKVKQIRKRELICAYGCGKKAHYLLGADETPCCSKTFYDCPSGHWKTNDFLDNPERKAKAEATMLQRYGVTNPNDSPELKAKRIATNIERYGGPAPVCDPTIARKIHDAWEKKRQARL